MNREKLTTSAWSLAVLVLFLLLWEYLPGWLGVPQFVLPPFSQVVTEGARIWQGERLLWHASITAAEVVIGFILGSVLGAVIGYALGISPRVEAILSPYLLALQIAPKVAFAPLFVMWLGYTIYPKILVAVLIVFFPVLVNVLTAMRTMDGDLINLARSFSATRFQVFRMVEFPTTLPPLFSGLRIASTLALAMCLRAVTKARSLASCSFHQP
jgi:NitT/TauT family transport system permease protein